VLLTFQKLSRVLLDLSRQSGIPVDRELAGEDIDLYRKMIEAIQDPLMHMVRNSIDHGIEATSKRVAEGKPAAARLSIRAAHEAGAVVIAITDDGAGLPTATIKAQAIAKGLIAEDAVLSDPEIHELIFRPGFSTAEQVSEVSGRGVGMDVVQRNVHALHGRVDVHTLPGAGTTFRIRVPLTLAMAHGLLVTAGGDRFLVPTSAIRETVEPPAADGHETGVVPRRLDVRDRTISIARLADALGLADRREHGRRDVAVVLEDGDRRAAVIVDELVGMQEVVIKPLGPAFADVRGIAGAAVLGDGHVGLILDPGSLIALIDGPAMPEAD
jgi:two-component system chemotaxis sensor kinase CheA